MKRISIKKIIVTLVFFVLLLLFFYGRSYVPKEINMSYKGIMYNQEAYVAGDYENLNIRETTVHIRGELHRPWFKDPYFVGYIDTDLAVVDETALRPTSIWPLEYIPIPVIYHRWTGSKLKNLIYGSVFMYKDLSKIHLLFTDDFTQMDYSTSTEFNGNAVVAPAQGIEDVTDIWEEIMEYRTPR